jgi:hypothetical protein
MNGTTSNAPIEIDDASTVNSHDGIPEEEHPVLSHYAYKVLQTRNPFTLKKKVEILVEWKNFDRSFFHPASMVGREIPNILLYIKNTSAGVLQKQGGEKLADLLTNLILTFEKSTESYEASGKRQGRASLIPECIKNLKKVMAQCKDHYETQSAKATVASSAGPGKLRLPKKTDAFGKTWQQTHSGFDPAEGACNPCCPACRLLTTNAVSIATEENTRNATQHAEELAAWDAAGGAKSKKTKPKNPKTKSDTMACFAATQNCMLHPQGIGCFHCQALCEAGAPPARQEHRNGVICSCLICQETCDTVFYRHQRQDYVDEIDAAKAAAAGQAQAGKMIVVFLDALTAFGAGLYSLRHLPAAPPCS